MIHPTEEEKGLSQVELVNRVEHWLNMLAGVPHEIVAGCDRDDLLDVLPYLSYAAMEFDCEDSFEHRKEMPRETEDQRAKGE